MTEEKSVMGLLTLEHHWDRLELIQHSDKLTLRQVNAMITIQDLDLGMLSLHQEQKMFC